MRYLAILSLLAAGFMLFQIAVLRELRFQLSTLFTLTPFLFSSVIIFIGIGSIAARLVKGDGRRILRWGVTILPLLLIPLFAVTLVVAQGMIDHTSSAFTYGPDTAEGSVYLDSIVVAFIAVAILGYGPIFCVQGLLFTIYFREGRKTGILSRVYAVDLGASGLAALLGGLLSFALSPIQLVLLATGVFLANLWVACRYLEIEARIALGVTILVLGMVGGEWIAGPVATQEAPRWLEPGLVYSRWSPYRRIDVVDRPGEFDVYADGIKFHPYRKEDNTHSWDPKAIPVRTIFPNDPSVKTVLVIGAGTGSDVRILRDLVPRDLEIVAVDIDAGFVETSKAFPWLWDYYKTAEIVVEEGRYYLENTERQFGLVLYAFIDPQSAISKVGIPDANFLYTVEGIRSAYSRVREGGYLVINRIFFVEEEETFIQRFCATLGAAGITPSQTRIYRGAGSVNWGYYGSLTGLHVVIRKGGDPPKLPGFVPKDWVEGGKPTTDRFPFSLLTGVWFDQLLDYARSNLIILPLLGLFFGLLALRIATSVSHLSFFLLGVGSFLAECLVLFYSFLLIGNPSLSAAVGVGFLLFWNGIGSLSSDWLERRRGFYPLVAVLVLLYGVSAPWLSAATIASPISLRVIAFAAHLALPGIAIGAMFPVGLRLFRKERVASLFFIDLVGCALAPALFWIAMSSLGVTSVAFASAAAYGILAVIFLSRRG